MLENEYYWNAGNNEVMSVTLLSKNEIEESLKAKNIDEKMEYLSRIQNSYQSEMWRIVDKKFKANETNSSMKKILNLINGLAFSEKFLFVTNDNFQLLCGELSKQYRQLTVIENRIIYDNYCKIVKSNNKSFEKIKKYNSK